MKTAGRGLRRGRVGRRDVGRKTKAAQEGVRGSKIRRVSYKGSRRRLEDALLEGLGDAPYDDDGNVDWTEVPLGQVPDCTLARWLNLPDGIVRGRRQLFGIKKSSTTSLIDWSRLPLGKIPDTYIAAMTGLTHPTVLNARRDRGLPPAPKETHRDGRPAPIPVSEFVIPIRRAAKTAPSAERRRTRRPRSIWDIAEEAMQFLRVRETVTVDELLKSCGVRLREGTRRGAEEFLQRLEWSPKEADGSWRRPGIAGRVARPCDPERVSDAVLDLLSAGVWTVARLGRRLGLPSATVNLILQQLVDDGDIRRLPSTAESLYILSPRLAGKRGRRS